MYCLPCLSAVAEAKEGTEFDACCVFNTIAVMCGFIGNLHVFYNRCHHVWLKGDRIFEFFLLRIRDS